MSENERSASPVSLSREPDKFPSFLIYSAREATVFSINLISLLPERARARCFPFVPSFAERDHVAGIFIPVLGNPAVSHSFQNTANYLYATRDDWIRRVARRKTLCTRAQSPHRPRNFLPVGYLYRPLAGNNYHVSTHFSIKKEKSDRSSATVLSAGRIFVGFLVVDEFYSGQIKMPRHSIALQLVIRGRREFRWWIVDNWLLDNDRSAIVSWARRATAKD